MKKARNLDEEFYIKKYDWMTDDQWECFQMLCDLCHGGNHMFGKVKPSFDGILINIRSGFDAATFAYDGLTRAVLLAHDRCIRFEIKPSGPGMLKLLFHKRQGMEGRMHLRHPTIEEAIKKFRDEQ